MRQRIQRTSPKRAAISHPTKAMIDRGYSEAKSRLSRQLEGTRAESDAERIVHETLLRVWEEHGRWVDPNELGDDLLLLIAKQVAAEEMSDVRVRDYVTPSTVVARSLITDFPEDELIAQVDAEPVRRTRENYGRWVRRLAVLITLTPLAWWKRIVENPQLTVGAAGATTIAVAAGITVATLFPDDGLHGDTPNLPREGPIVQSSDVDRDDKRVASSRSANHPPPRPSGHSVPFTSRSTGSAESTVPVTAEVGLSTETGPGRKQASKIEFETPIGPVGVSSHSDADGPAIVSSPCDALPGGCTNVRVAAKDASTTDGMPMP